MEAFPSVNTDSFSINANNLSKSFNGFAAVELVSGCCFLAKKSA
jgi:hypothetical protein